MFSRRYLMSLKMVQVALSVLLLTAEDDSQIGPHFASRYMNKDISSSGFQASFEVLFGSEKQQHCVLGAPFLPEEEANEFIRLKRQTLYSQNFWDSSNSQNAWGYTVAEQVSESWTFLRTTAQYYVGFDPATAWDHIRSYMDMLQQSGAHLQQQRRKHN